MLKKNYRGLSAAEVSELFGDKSFSSSNKYFHINWAPSTKNFPQFAVITPKKLRLNAVQRNCFQRRAYAAIRLHFSSWTVGAQIAIVVKKVAVESNAAEFREHLLKLLRTITL